jgi:hypothetical protein
MMVAGPPPKRWRGRDGRSVNAELFTGTIGLFERAGFEIVTRPPTGRRVVMRKQL